jgi:hypothetical protein
LRNTSKILLLFCVVVFSCSRKQPNNNAVVSHCIISISLSSIDTTIHDAGIPFLCLSLSIDKEKSSNYEKGKYQLIELIGDSILSSELKKIGIDTSSDSTNRGYILLLQEHKRPFSLLKHNYFVLFTADHYYEIFEVSGETVMHPPQDLR